VFVDTPGIFRPRRRLDRAMVTVALGQGRRKPMRSVADRGRRRFRRNPKWAGARDSLAILDGLKEARAASGRS
jgi:hypothetical protein